MKRYIYTLFLSMLFICGCTSFTDKDELTIQNSSVQVMEDGSLGVSFNISMLQSSDISVATRSATTTIEGTIVDGWAVVFGKDESSSTGYGDNSVLLQKVAFKIAGDGSAFVIFDEQTDFCFIRLLANLTTNTTNQVYNLVSQKDIDDGTVTGKEVSTFKDYKYLSVGLLGYYASDENPDPGTLRTDANESGVVGYPCASPGYEMPSGLTITTLEDLNNTEVYMVPVGSKLDVSVDGDCDFTLSAARLYNGAKRALMRSTVLEDDGLTEINDYPLPTNFGGVNYNFQWASAANNTTSSTPIYFYPNEGDIPLKDGEDATYTTTTGDGTTATEEAVTTDHNPTYVIIKGTASGYNMPGYYKVAIKYIPSGDNSYDDQSTFDGTYTYDIIRNGHYQIKLLDVASPGYATEEEAIAGPASDITYSISVDTNGDSRNETVISSSGLYSMELNASSVYVRGWSADGIDMDLPVWLGTNESDDVTDYDYSLQKAYIIGSDNVKITSDTEISNVISGDKIEIKFTVTGDGSITIRYGDVAKEIPVYHENTSVSMYGNETISVNGTTVYDSYSSFSGTLYDNVNSTSTSDSDDVSAFFNASSNNQTAEVEGVNDFTDADDFQGRTFDGYIYPSDMSGGIVRLYCHQGMIPFHDTYTLSGTPDEDIVYYILNYEDYKHLYTAVNGDGCTAKTFSNCNFRMLIDVDLTEDGYTHTAVGTSSTYSFGGTLDGFERKVTGLKISSSSNYQGLFGYVSGATIKDLTIEDSSISSSGSYVGGLVGYAYAKSTVDNCHNYASVSGSRYVGGIVGYSRGTGVTGATNNNNIKGCTNSGSILGNSSTATNSDAGGIAGISYCTALSECKNLSAASVEGLSICVGGVVGRAYHYSTISDCTNEANIKGYRRTGGILGQSSGNSGTYLNTVTSCENLGSVESTTTTSTENSVVGGVVGYSELYSEFTSCTNSSQGSVKGSSAQVGGIVGRASTYSTFNYCDNNGFVSGLNSVGGVVGYAESNATIDGCDNNATDVTSSGYYTGGIAGYAGVGSSIKNSDNYATVSSSNYGYIGGVLGYAATGTSSSYVTVDNCTNNVTQSFGSSSYSGGVVGYANAYSQIMNCTNEKQVSSTATCLGGVVGYIDSGTVSGCTNKGYVYHPSTTTYNVGGVVGYVITNTASSQVTNCTNSGQVYSKHIRTGGVIGIVTTGSSSSIYTTVSGCTNTAKVSSTEYQVGGVVGVLGTYAKVSGSSNSGAVSGTCNVGGIVGYTGSSITVSSCSNSGSISGSVSSVDSYIADDVTLYGVGGIAGQVYSGTLTDCYNTNASATVTGTSYVAGVIGYAGSSLSVNRCYNKAAVTASSNYAGGVVAYTGSSPLIYNSFNTGAVKGYRFVAGIAAYLGTYSDTHNCYNTATLTATYTTNLYTKCLGGIVGSSDIAEALPTYSRPVIYGCYNSGTLVNSSTSTSIGGIIGYPPFILLYGSYYYDIEDCYYSTSCGSNNSYGTSISAANMKLSSFATTMNAWSSSSAYSTWVWDSAGTVNGGYPYFSWQ